LDHIDELFGVMHFHIAEEVAEEADGGVETGVHFLLGLLAAAGLNPVHLVVLAQAHQLLQLLVVGSQALLLLDCCLLVVLLLQLGKGNGPHLRLHLQLSYQRLK
jgi:hypothetical protein